MSEQRIILCPGQGAQFVGMGKAWFEKSAASRAVFEEADRVLAGRLPGGAKLSDLCFSGPAEVLNRTDVSQPAIYTASMACWRGLVEANGEGFEKSVIATAGLSLGEYTALAIAGVFSFAAGLELVALRGQAMQEAAEAVPSSMVALIGASEEQARAVCEETLEGMSVHEVLVCANFNAPGQVVISGTKAACEKAAGAGGVEGPAARMGLRATALAVAGAFHSPIMAPAAARLGAALAGVKMVNPRCVVMSNVTGAAHDAGPDTTMDEERAGEGAASIGRRLVEQLTASVRWSDSCVWLTSHRPGATWVEVAPGKTLAGLMRRIDKAVKVQNYDEPG